jgi:uncharacterized membrane protein
MRRYRIGHALAQRLWIIPSLGLVAGIVLSLVTVAIDRRNENGLLSQSIVGNGTDAQSILTTIATAVVTLTSIVLTVTLVAVQLAMGQFSPRIVRTLLGDRGDQFAVSVFGATFTFALFSLRAVDTGPGGEAVPGLTVLTALALAAAKLGRALHLRAPRGPAAARRRARRPRRRRPAGPAGAPLPGRAKHA